MRTKVKDKRRIYYKVISADTGACRASGSWDTYDGRLHTDILLGQISDIKKEGRRAVKTRKAEFSSGRGRISGRVYQMRVRQKKIRKFVTMLLFIAAFFTGFFGHSLFNSFAKEEDKEALKPYYTSIQLQPGDNLWKIAYRYADGSGYTVPEYVEELKRMNGLKDGTIHSGEYLTIVYYKK